MSILGRLMVYLVLALIAVTLSLGSVYGYGKWFNHDRYWHGTIARVQQNQAILLRAILTELPGSIQVPASEERLSRMFSILDNHLIVDVYQRGEQLYSSDNGRFPRGALLEQMDLAEDLEVRISRYQPPTWNALFVRWLKSPSRWLEPSFDHITFPFLWFLGIHGLSLLALAFIAKSRYLENDVMAALRKIESRVAK